MEIWNDMGIFNKINIQHLCHFGSEHIDAKVVQGELPDSVWETYSSFANTDGGVILLGVDELNDHSFSIVGLTNAAILREDFWNQIRNRQVTNVNILTCQMVRVESIDGKEILVIEVPRAERTLKPVYKGRDMGKGTFRRKSEGNYLCSYEEVSSMLRDASLSSNDMKVLTDMDASVFCFDSIRDYRQIFNSSHPNHVWAKLDDELFLRRLGAMGLGNDGEFHPTVAGLLMFGYEHAILREFPQYVLDYQEDRQAGVTRWTDRIVSFSGDWSGNVFDFIVKVTPRLCGSFKVPYVVKGGMQVIDTPLHKVVREALTNACVQADFYGQRGLVVEKNAQQLLFSNPGCLRLSQAEILDGGVSDARNCIMQKMLSLIGFGTISGNGMKFVHYVWNSVYKSLPVLDEQIGDDRVTLTLDTYGNEPDMDALIALYDVCLDGVSNIEYQSKPTDCMVKTDGFSHNSTGYRYYSAYSDGFKSIIDKISTDNALNRRERKVLIALAKLGPSQVSAVSADIELGTTQTKLYLRQLVEKGRATSTGSTRDRTYSIKNEFYL